MQWTCGGEITNSSHEVKTEKKANECAEGYFNKELDLPLEIESYNCNGCTRFAYKVINVNGNILKRFNI